MDEVRRTLSVTVLGSGFTTVVVEQLENVRAAAIIDKAAKDDFMR